MRAALQRLVDDPVAAVRAQLALYLRALERTDPELMWMLIERMAHREMVRAVLRDLVTRVLAHLAGSQMERTIPLVEGIYARASQMQGADMVRVACAEIFVGLSLWRAHHACMARVHTMIDEPIHHSAELEHVVHGLRDRLSQGLPPGERKQPEDSQKGAEPTLEDEVRRRAHDLFLSIAQTVRDRAAELRARHQDRAWEQWPDTDRQQLITSGKLLHTISKEFFFASGAFAREAEAKGQSPGTNAVRLTEGQRRRFFAEMQDIFDLLGGIADASIAHDVLQTLAAYIDIDPDGVLQLIGRTVRAANTAGYQYEALAVDLLVNVVERYLAEYRPLVRDSERNRALLLDVLDGFVAVGWPSARRLVNRLDTIYR